MKVNDIIDNGHLFEMANLRPRTTGLPMVIWVSERGKARHDARIKVCMTHGDRMDIDNTATVAIRPSPRLIAGQLDSHDFNVVSRWIYINYNALIGYWDNQLDTAEFLSQLKRL